MRFKLRNIFKELDSTLLGLLMAMALLLPVYFGMATFQDVMPGLVVVLPLLLGGKDDEIPPHCPENIRPLQGTLL